MGDLSDIAATRQGKARRFAAFISYSHADTVAASKLQRRLERYRLPRRIADTRANNAASLGPIFRDREDLAAAASLSAAIRDAIARAEALVVLCSPEASASPWVSAEIELFRELHPDRPILAAIISGEPAKAFPAVLTAGGNEPLAADLRPEGDGEALGFLKIVAGIACVPLDSLIQRDAQRRIRRVTAITAGALAAMLAMGIMTSLALQARNEAARQRTAAEGLVEYMLTDLREKLRGVGRIEIMDAVNDRAMTYYKDQAKVGQLSDDSAERRARILHAMGEDYDRQGKLELALSPFLEAYATTAALLERAPGNRDRIFAHAQSEYWLGYMAYRKKDRQKTLTHFGNYRTLANRLIAADPKKSEWVREGGYAEGNLCTFYLEEPKEPAKAVTHCKASLEAMRTAKKLTPNDPQSLIDVVNRLNWLVDAHFAAGDSAAALASSTELTLAADDLARLDPRNADYAEMALRALITAGKAQFRAGRPADGERQHLRARAMLQQLQAVDADNAVWKELGRKVSTMAQIQPEVLGNRRK